MLTNTIAFHIEKVGKDYLWRGSPTNNGRDVDDEIVYRIAIETEVLKMQNADRYPDLWFYHIPWPIASTEFAGSHDGVMYAAGRFHHNAVSKAIAESILRMPLGLDGSGWGMSWQFYPARQNSDGGYPAIRRTKEFTVLPASAAANRHVSQ